MVHGGLVVYVQCTSGTADRTTAQTPKSREARRPVKFYWHGIGCEEGLGMWRRSQNAAGTGGAEAWRGPELRPKEAGCVW
jgi:hypothetical protein